MGMGWSNFSDIGDGRMDGGKRESDKGGGEFFCLEAVDRYLNTTPLGVAVMLNPT